MGKIVKYVHHGTLVSVDEDILGKHREHCLCFRNCALFIPGSEFNCQMAQENYEFCVKYDTVTPVYECPEYVDKEHDKDD